TLAYGSYADTIRLCSTATGQEIRTIGKSAWVTSVAFSPDGRALASGNFDLVGHVWDVATGHEIHALSSHTSAVVSVAFSADDKTLAVGSQSSPVRLWDLSADQPMRALD